MTALKLVSETTDEEIDTLVDRRRDIINRIHKQLINKYGRAYIHKIEERIDTSRKLSYREKQLYKLLIKLEKLNMKCYSDSHRKLELAYSKELTWLDLARQRCKQPTIFMKNSKKHRNHKMPRGRRW